MLYLNSDFDKKNAARLLVKHHFVNDKAKEHQKYQNYKKAKDPKVAAKEFKKLTDDDLLKLADMEIAEISKNETGPTTYPSPFKRHVLGVQDPNKTVLENAYFWMLGHMTEAWGYNQVYKVTDSFAGSSQSSFFGAGSQRLSILQDRVSNTLQTIGRLVQEMWPQIHELHIWDERKGWYDRMNDDDDRAADMALKGTWIDLIEGGSENPSSVFGLGQKVGFAILPDLFLNTFVKSTEEVDEVVERDAKEYNKEVRNILKRKLFQYTRWRIESEKEVNTRRRFIIRYLRQHFNTIKMYLGWVKPFLKQLKFMQQNADFQARPEMVNSFEGSIMEVEILATKMNYKKYFPVALMNFYYTTRPDMNMTDPSYQHRGPSHAGEVYVTMRSYVWTKEQIENYKKMRDEEDMEYLKELDGGLKAALDEFGEDLSRYMDEINVSLVDDKTLEQEAKKEEKEKEDSKKKKKGPTIYEPFGAVFGGFKELFGPLLPSINIKLPDNDDYKTGLAEGGEKKKAAKDASNALKVVFKNYRKANKMITW